MSLKDQSLLYFPTVQVLMKSCASLNGRESNGGYFCSQVAHFVWNIDQILVPISSFQVARWTVKTIICCCVTADMGWRVEWQSKGAMTHLQSDGYMIVANLLKLLYAEAWSLFSKSYILLVWAFQSAPPPDVS
ncbi:unnamed protein product [Sphagnum jensenii]|uniref:Uncharacterized protein n=1 Tax=Sphagnum jensenii TaxID=128206 RepID=A0ABP1BTS3_9BRYO